jgi:hypothetical protein
VARIAGRVPRRGAVGIAPVAISYERPSRASRALVIVSALVVVVLAAWVLTPILLTNYPAAFAAIPLLRDVVADGATSDPRAQTPPANGRRSRESRDLAIERPVAPREPAKATTTAEPTSPPIDEQNPPAPTVVAAPVDPTAANEPVTTVAPAAPAGLMPWPTAEPQANPSSDAELVAESNSPPADFGPVPLPPRRPDASSLARLGTPLPRPRPAAAPPAGPDTIPETERLLFDRLTAPN